MNTKTLLRCLLACLFSAASAGAQNLDFVFRMYLMDSAIADAFQAKLISGGDTATQAFAKMPDLVRQGRAKLEVELKQQAPDKQHSTVTSGNKMHKNRDGTEAKLGLDIEFEPVIAAGIVNCRLTAGYNLEEKNDVKRHNLATSFIAKSGVPVLLARWQEGDVNHMLIASATLANPTEPLGAPICMIYLDTSIYQTDADAKASRNPVSRIVCPGRSGGLCSANVDCALYYRDREEGAWEYMESTGMGMNAQPALAVDASSISLAYTVSHKQATGDKRKLPSGLRIPEVICRITNQSAKFSIAESKTADLSVEKRNDPDTKAPDWKVATKCLLYEVK